MSDTQWIVTHFSPTGTTAKTALAIAKGSGCAYREIDLSAPVQGEQIGAGDVLLAAMPVYGGRVPSVALERLTQLRGSGQKAAAVVVYGNRAYEDALLELKNTLENNGFQVVAGAAFIAEHSIVRSIAAGRPDAQDLQAAERFGAAIMKKLTESASIPSVQVPGNFPYKVFKGLPAHPKANKQCVQCGACARACPVGAIPLESPQKTDSGKCITCMRCVSVCPHGARGLPAPVLLASQTMLKTAAAGRKEPEYFI